MNASLSRERDRHTKKKDVQRVIITQQIMIISNNHLSAGINQKGVKGNDQKIEESKWIIREKQQ